MIYSQACAYALRALAHLHRLSAQKQERVRISDICEIDDALPSPFIAKIFQQLARQGWLKSSRGRSGGFRLAKPAESIFLKDLVIAIDGQTEGVACISGLSECNDNMPCPLHEHFSGVRKSICRFLEETSLADMSCALTKKIDLMATQNPLPSGLTISVQK